MRRYLGLILAVILLITSFGCIWDRDHRRHDDRDRRGHDSEVRPIPRDHNEGDRHDSRDRGSQPMPIPR